MTDPFFLTLDDVLELHADQLRLFGGADGIRDRGALESAIETPRATFDGEFLHDSLFSMAAAYAFHISESQAFVDGNKRTGLNSALVFLHLNGWQVLDPEGQLYDSMIDVSARRMNKSALAGILESLSEPLFQD